MRVTGGVPVLLDVPVVVPEPVEEPVAVSVAVLEDVTLGVPELVCVEEIVEE